MTTTDARPGGPVTTAPDTVTDARLASLHPDCPDLRRLGPTAADARVRARAAAVEAEREARQGVWDKGFTRRRMLAGGLGVGVAAIGMQSVTTRVSFAAPVEGASAQGTLVVVFLRGGMDGLSVVVPAEDPDYLAARPTIAVRGGSLIPLGDRAFGLHPSLEPLRPLLDAGRVAAVPAISTPDLSRSHFQAQDCLERGGAEMASARTGWLDRVLEASGPGTTFRAIGVGSRLPRSLVGGQGALALRDLESLTLQGWDGVRDQSLAALRSLYTGIDHPLGAQATLALDAVATAESVVAGDTTPEDAYPDSGFGQALREVARMVKADVGLRVACIDLGGWDMHTDLGTVDNGDMKNILGGVATALAAFGADLGPKLDTTTVVTMSEFGRRIEENANTGTDHGHGGVALLLGGGVKGGVHGTWDGLAPEVRDQGGDVPGSNDYRDLLGELVGKRLGVSTAALDTVFPGHAVTPLGVMS